MQRIALAVLFGIGVFASCVSASEQRLKFNYPANFPNSPEAHKRNNTENPPTGLDLHEEMVKQNRPGLIFIYNDNLTDNETNRATNKKWEAFLGRIMSDQSLKLLFEGRKFQIFPWTEAKFHSELIKKHNITASQAVVNPGEKLENWQRMHRAMAVHLRPFNQNYGKPLHKNLWVIFGSGKPPML